MKMVVKRSVLLLSIFLLPSFGIAALPEGSWRVSGDISDVLMGSKGRSLTNTLSINGDYDNGHFLINVVPVNTLDNVAESAGWDGEFLRLIQRFPDLPGKGQPRDRSLGFVEPSVLSRYSSEALTSVLLAFADSNSLSRLETGQDVVILKGQGKFAEEDNKYTVTFLQSNGVSIQAFCHGQEIGPTGKIPIEGFESGFTRWTFKSTQEGFSGSNDVGQLMVEYSRFIPIHGSLLQVREVTGNLRLEPEASGPEAAFQPEITENQLTVWDYSERPMLLQFYKQGLPDQNYTYVLTNKIWAFDTNVILAAFMEKKTLFTRSGIPAVLADTVQETSYDPHLRKHRIQILFILVVISMLFAWAAFRPKRIP